MSPTRVVIAGAGAFGREVLQYVQDAASTGAKLEVIGFLDDADVQLTRFGIKVPVWSTRDIVSVGADGFVVAVGDPRQRQTFAERISSLGGTLISVVHPSAYVAPSAQIGRGSIVAPFSMVSVQSVVGENVAINVHAMVGHDVHVGDHSVISPYAALAGHAEIGGGVFLGTHATLSPLVSVGPWSKVSAGSVVSRNAEAGSLLVGNPAKGRVMFDVN